MRLTVVSGLLITGSVVSVHPTSRAGAPRPARASRRAASPCGLVGQLLHLEQHTETGHPQESADKSDRSRATTAGRATTSRCRSSRRLGALNASSSPRIRTTRTPASSSTPAPSSPNRESIWLISSSGQRRGVGRVVLRLRSVNRDGSARSPRTPEDDHGDPWVSPERVPCLEIQRTGGCWPPGNWPCRADVGPGAERLQHLPECATRGGRCRASAHDTSTPEQSATIGGLPVRTHDHVCVLYRGDDQRDELMADFLADGIPRATCATA